MPSKGMDGGVTMIKDLGHLGVNGLSYNWGNMGIAFGGSQAESKQNQDLANLSKAVTIGADSILIIFSICKKNTFPYSLCLLHFIQGIKFIKRH